MSILEVIVIAGFVSVILCIDSLQRDLRRWFSEDQKNILKEVVAKLDRIEGRISEIEGHTGRVAEPLYDQDKVDREFLVGKYAEPY